MVNINKFQRILDEEKQSDASRKDFVGKTAEELSGEPAGSMLPIPMPRKQQVEDLISQRKSPIDTLRGISEDASSGSSDMVETLIDAVNPLKSIPRGLGTIGSGFKYAESIFAGPLFKGLTGEAGEMINELKLSVKGKGTTELGDVLRSTGIGGKYNEAISAIGGMVAFAGISNLAFKNGIVKGAKKMWNGFKDGIAKHSKVYTQAADDFINGIDDVQAGLNSEFDKLYNKIGNNMLDVESKVDVQDVMVNLPAFMKSRVNKSWEALKGTSLFKKGKIKSRVVKATKSGKIKTTNFKTQNATKQIDDIDINTAKVMKDEISRYIIGKVWRGVEQATPEQSSLMDDYARLSNAIAKNSGKMKGKLLDLNKRYSEVKNMIIEIMPILRKGSGATKTTIRHLTPRGVGGGFLKLKKAEGVSYQDEYQTMLNFSGTYFNKGLSILKDINKYNNEILFTRAKNAAGLAGAAYGADFLIKRPIRETLVEGTRTSDISN